MNLVEHRQEVKMDSTNDQNSAPEEKQIEVEEVTLCEVCERIATTLHRDRGKDTLCLLCDEHSQELTDVGRIDPLIARCAAGWTQRDRRYFPTDPAQLEHSTGVLAFEMINGILVTFQSDPAIPAKNSLILLHKLRLAAAGKLGKGESDDQGKNHYLQVPRL
jgi:hypothetical protein